MVTSVNYIYSLFTRKDTLPLCKNVSKGPHAPLNFKDTKLLSKGDLRRRVGYLTGHQRTKYHLHKMGIEQETDCRL